MKTFIKNTTIFASVAVATFMAVAVFSPATKSNADEFDVGVNVSSVISLSTSSASVMMNAPVGGGFTSGNTSAVVLTNSAYGYTLAIEDTDNNTSLTSTTSEDEISSNYLGSKTEDTLAENTWGFSVDGTKFYAIPKKNSPLILSRAMLPTSDDGSTTTLYFGVKTARNLTSGIYTNRIILTAYTNGVDGNPEGVDPSSDDPEELSDEIPEPYDIGEGANENKLVLLKSMQDPKLKKYCSESYTPTTAGRTVAMTRYFSTNSAPRAVVKDVRDGNKYLITKLADGNCWMTQNLALDLDTSETLTADTTDLNTKESWTPATSTYMTKVSWGNNATAVSDSVRSFHPESGEAFIKGGTATSESPTEDTPSYLWEKNGNYYNWKAATAGTGSSGSGWTTINDSICPKGWKLPGWDANDKSFWSLLSNTYGLGSYGGNDMITTPFNFIRSGRITWSNGVLDRIGEGYFWTNTSRGGDAGNILHHTGYISQNAQSKAYGLSIRCVAR